MGVNFEVGAQAVKLRFRVASLSHSAASELFLFAGQPLGELVLLGSLELSVEYYVEPSIDTFEEFVAQRDGEATCLYEIVDLRAQRIK